MKKLEIIALDLSLNSTGYAVLELKEPGKEVQLIEKGIIKAKAKENHHQKLTRHNEVLKRLLSDYPNAIVVKEQLLFSPPRSAAILAKVHGVADLVFKEVYQIYPSTVKKVVTGNGRANKQQVEQSVYEHLGLTESELVFKSDDESDAVAVGLAYLFSR